MSARIVDSLHYPPRGLSRDEAARYIGVSASKFDQMVADNCMPRPKRLGGRVVWDRVALDMAFNALPDENSGHERFFEDLFDKRKAS
ncbi:helix-turn-helix transcriptional regulator [Aquamicrobium zhengzhouense]|uniref:Helix-turn-helix domain-containing protein n=1 Tax=Aquamicrobium zhengzhouense TaxID=2781738 RepID=A0ABS0SBL2_9HYPH|nr:hypothetical protein [Aquamicrobium zhengzhouense]MBI1620096.1 hypothetical protein [Aquamicrobium zhengzhouense]